MKTGIAAIIANTKSFIRSLNIFYLLLIILMMGSFIFLNYRFGIEKNFLSAISNNIIKFAGFYLLYAAPFFCAYALQRIITAGNNLPVNKFFVLLLFAAPAIFAFRVSSNFHEGFVKSITHGDERIFWLACIGWLLRAAITIFLVYVIWRMHDKKSMPLYGTTRLNNVKPYLIMLLLMLPLLAWAATRHDFLEMYPRFKILFSLNSAHKTWRYLLYELCYGFDFISIEFFFRGFLILAFVRFCGTQAIIPAACFYCAIHFGKPMPEAISSFFGGSLLGLVSYHTKSIWGGLIVHLGIAWMMEAAGYIGHLL